MLIKQSGIYRPHSKWKRYIVLYKFNHFTIFSSLLRASHNQLSLLLLLNDFEAISEKKDVDDSMWHAGHWHHESLSLVIRSMKKFAVNSQSYVKMFIRPIRSPPTSSVIIHPKMVKFYAFIVTKRYIIPIKAATRYNLKQQQQQCCHLKQFTIISSCNALGGFY